MNFFPLSLLPPTTKLGQGYVFTRVCDSVHRGGMVAGGGRAWLLGGHVWLLGEGVCMVGGVWLLGEGGVHGCGGACMVARGAWFAGGVLGCQGACLVARGHAWLPGGHAWSPGGMHGCGGHAWLLGGMHGYWGACVVAGGHAWLPGGVLGCCGVGVCMVGRGACVGYNEIRSMNGRYASYWNAFLLYVVLVQFEPFM